MNLQLQVRTIIKNNYLAKIIALAGGIWYLIQSFIYAHTLPSVLDEGNYLVKGVLFTTGQYKPFQANGPWTNQMPFSYLIPGFFESIFGPGLRTGRYLSIAFGLLMLLGLWLLGRRFGNDWWAAGLVWIVAANPAFIRVYSLAVTQVLIACIFSWILYLTLEEPNKRWRLILAGALAGFMVLTRLNTAPVLPFLVFFVIWQFGWYSGVLSFFAGLMVLIIGHMLYWPNILQTWASWVPGKLSPFLDPWRLNNTGSGIWSPSISFGDRFASMLDGFRFNFIPLLVLIGFGILIFTPRSWKNRFYYRSAVFLTSLMSFMVLIHGWASLGNNYCVYCFSGYLMFFSPLILLLLVLVAASWKSIPSKWYIVFVLILTLAVTTLTGLGASQEVGKILINIPVPLFLIGTFRAGTIPLWGVLENGVGISIATSRWLVPTVLGGLTGIAIILGTILFVKKVKPRNFDQQHHFAPVVLSLLLLLGFILSPTQLISGFDQPVTCQIDVLGSIENTGEYLSSLISEGSVVYWLGSESAVPLLYINDIRIFPAQINDGYSYRSGGDTDTLLTFGLWNRILSNQWRDAADFILILENNYDQGWKAYLESGNFIEFPRSPSTNPCESKQRLRIFKRVIE